MREIERHGFSIRSFVWKSTNGRELKVKDMVTTQLFYTLRLIWNLKVATKDGKIVPELLVPGNYPLNYSYFDARHYSEEYLKMAIYAIGTELLTRKDLPAHLVPQLDFMVKKATQLKLEEEKTA